MSAPAAVLEPPAGFAEPRWRRAFGTLGRGWGWLLPALAVIGFVQIVPMMYAIWLSLHHKTSLGPMGPLVGFSNYVTQLGSAEFWASTGRGFVYAGCSTGLQLMVGLITALAVDRAFRGRSVARAIVLLPYMVPTATVALIFTFGFNNLYGVVNSVLTGIGALQDSVLFYGDPNWAMGAVILTAVWKWAPFATLMFLARLQTIDGSLYECARSEGATGWRMFCDITLPSLRSTLVLVIMLRGIWMFNQFDIPYLVTQGGPGERTQTLPLLAYEVSFQQHQQGMGATLAVLMFLLLAAVAIPYLAIFRPEREIVTE